MYQIFFNLVLATLATLASASDDDIVGPVPVGCWLPEIPEHGTYNVSGLPDARPGQILDNALLRYTCEDGYGIYGINEVWCVRGVWSEPLPTCVRFCKLVHDPNVEYKCVTPDGIQRDCSEYEPVGARAQTTCKYPDFYLVEDRPFITCLEDGSWSYSPKCAPDCGTLPSDGIQLVGISEKVNRLPWAAAIYVKKYNPYMLLCGGTLVSTTAVLSAASCFWSGERKQPAEDYAVAINKVYRPWNSTHDPEAHKSDVKDIHIPSRYTGPSTNYQDNIAVVVLQTAVEHRYNIKPACLNFDYQFENVQLANGNLGMIAIWGATPSGELRQEMKLVRIPYLDISDCIKTVRPEFRPYLSSDKFCAGYQNVTELGKGDSGSGLTFPYSDKGKERHYLMGITSMKLSDMDETAGGLVAFTNIRHYENFIRRYL